MYIFMNATILDSCTFLNFGKMSKDEILEFDGRKDRRNRFLVVDRFSGVCDVFEAQMCQRKSQERQSYSEGFVWIRIRGSKKVKYDIANETVWIFGGTRKAQIFDPGKGTPEFLMREESLCSVFFQRLLCSSENLQKRAIRRIEEMIEFPDGSRNSTKENLTLVREHHLLRLTSRQLRELDDWLRGEINVSRSMAA
jgi:hypothetical protein